MGAHSQELSTKSSSLDEEMLIYFVFLNKLINGGNMKRDCFFELIKESQSRCASLLQDKSEEYNKYNENVFDSLRIMQHLGGKSSITAIYHFQDVIAS
jgi:hypothetical protein